MKKIFSLSNILKIIYSMSIVYFLFFNKNIMSLLLSLFCLIGTFILEILYKKHILKEIGIYITLQLFLFFASFLGSSFNFYNIPNYDDFLHIWSGFICVAIAWNILGLFKYTKQLNPLFILIFLFMFSMGVASLWEISEYLMDTFIGTHTQRGLKDTNIDMIDCMIGSIFMCAYYFKKINKKEA